MTPTDAEFSRRLRALRAGPARLTDELIETIVSQVLSTMSCEDTEDGPTLAAELASLASFIREARAEIAAIQPSRIKAEHIPMATDELDAIVSATEDATNQIMEAAETIETMAETTESEVATKLVDAVTGIYEACAFQDITGQRVSKVIRTLKAIEAKVDALVAAVSEDRESASRGPSGAPKRDPGAPANEEDLMNGPQLPENAATQDEIDALFGDD